MICIIPARGGSKRLPGKNIMPFKGAPIIARPIKAAIDSGLFSKVIVSSDDETILAQASKHGAGTVHRPDHLATDESSELDAYRHVLDGLRSPPEFFCAIYPCAAFVTTGELRASLTLMKETGCDVLMGVTIFREQHPYQTLVIEGDYWKLKFPDLNEGAYPLACASNGSLYWFRTSEFMKNPSYFPKKLGAYPTFNIDINTIDDFRKAEALA